MKTSIARLSVGLFFFLVIIACGVFAQPEPSPDAIETSSSPTETSAPESQGVIVATSSPLPSATPTTAGIVSQISPSGELYAFIQAPDGVVAEPYVVLTGFRSAPDPDVEIRGILNSVEFRCAGSPCVVPVQTSANIVFYTVSRAGDTSEEVAATIRVQEVEGGYSVTVDAVTQFAYFSDACLNFWRVEDTNPVWAEFVQFPYNLNTDKTLHYLATRLIIYGIVDTGGCTAGGLSTGLDWPTACGLERASNKLIEWQNQYDEYIWLASKDIGVPPKILKTLIEVESQFWPGNERFYVDEVGLGQVNQLGVDVLLRRDSALYQSVCATVLSDCSWPYALLPAQQQAMIRGALIASQNSLCSTCQYGLDLNQAKQSIPFIARVLRANCEQVKVVIDAYRSEDLEDDEPTPYEDYWRFTLLSYHSGISCFEQAVKIVSKGNQPMTWDRIAANLDCAGGERYVDGFWNNLLSFDFYRYTPSTTDFEVVQLRPVFAPTNTPIPSPTSALSSAQVWVQVYLDRNQNGIGDEGEWVDGIPVLLTSEDGRELTGETVEGKYNFDLTGFIIGTEVEVSLPGLYRSEILEVPGQGIVPVVFVFTQPVLPTIAP